MKYLENHIEALIFCASEPISKKDIQACLSEMLDSEIPKSDIEEGLIHLVEKYKSDNYAFEIVQIAGGYQFLTKTAYQDSLAIFLKHQSKKQLSKSALETLAIIAYKQPITKGEIEKIRGVGSDYAVQKLLEKELISIKGKADTPGKPILYGTSNKFMAYFGINDLTDLPQPKDFAEKEISEGMNLTEE